MSTNRHIDKILLSVVAVTLVITLLFMNGEYFGLTVLTKAVKYESTLFDTAYVHTIDIFMDDWDNFIESCEDEEYAPCTVVIDGEKHTNIAIRAKGNTSLSNVKSLNSQRYSFKLEFDHYQSSSSLDGLDKLCLNNLIQDNTMMKDYLTYRMMNDFGAESPLCSFAYLTVNGEDWGLYLAVEAIEDSFLSRNYGNDTGELYKPDSVSFGGGRGNGKDFDMDDFDFDSSDTTDTQNDNNNSTEQKQSEDTSQDNSQNSENTPPEKPNEEAVTGEMPTGDFNPEEMPTGEFTPGEMPTGEFTRGEMPTGDFNPEEMPTGDFNPEEMPTGDFNPEELPSGKGGGFFGNNNGMGGMGSDDVKLKYIDDNADSYSNIFNNAKTDVSGEDEQRLIASLKNLSEYTDLENTLNMDEVLRYFVVHNFVCNGDSYTGSMIHNYYLHENDGQLSMIAWDYNLAFGTFQGNNASSAVNTSIDNPISNSTVDDRPMFGWILSDETYTEQYHLLFADFIEKWFTNGELESLISETSALIAPYVEKDPTKFCTTQEFETGVEALTQFVTLRAKAVSQQLNGDDTAVETGELNLSDMGSMGGNSGDNMGGRQMPGGFGNNENNTSENNGEPASDAIPDETTDDNDSTMIASEQSTIAETTTNGNTTNEKQNDRLPNTTDENEASTGAPPSKPDGDTSDSDMPSRGEGFGQGGTPPSAPGDGKQKGNNGGFNSDTTQSPSDYQSA